MSLAYSSDIRGYLSISSLLPVKARNSIYKINSNPLQKVSEVALANSVASVQPLYAMTLGERSTITN